MRHSSDRFDIDDVTGGIANRLTEDSRGLLINQALNRIGRIIRCESNVDSLFRQHVLEQRVRAAVQLRSGHNIVAAFSNVQYRIINGRAARTEAQAGDTTFQFGRTLFEHINGRVHNARIDVALNLQIEQCRAVRGVIEFICNSLINRNSDSLCRGICFEACMYCECFVFHYDSFRNGVRPVGKPRANSAKFFVAATAHPIFPYVFDALPPTKRPQMTVFSIPDARIKRNRLD